MGFLNVVIPGEALRFVIPSEDGNDSPPYSRRGQGWLTGIVTAGTNHPLPPPPLRRCEKINKIGKFKKCLVLAI